ncbi:hypothetical protein FOPG_18904 [Fusarium oxysporum f. sp. conglutinans race 2 54008]|uniref:Uncharacterized protein n=1 Tax=Fusarium oxysporum f. sp. conglutinans race 2 54008 TaxID=1089457 RepID=X0GNJ7_FUSOX|nr:hypothetical protein FOPG_18904 [Fusarium oxysporum f. sp. conglutinans race 2 54008]
MSRNPRIVIETANVEIFIHSTTFREGFVHIS